MTHRDRIEKSCLPLALVGIIGSALAILSWFCSKQAPQGQSIDAIHPQDSTESTHTACHINLPPFVTVRRAPSEEEISREARNEARDRWKLRVTIATALIVLAYTVVSFLQWRAINEQAHIMQESSRPYVGVADIKRTSLQPGKDGASFIVTFKNFGERPAFEFGQEFTIFIDNLEQAPTSVPQGPEAITFYPGVAQYLRLNISEPRWSSIDSGLTHLRVRSRIHFKWPENGTEYKECEDRRYDTNGTFPIAGNCPIQ